MAQQTLVPPDSHHKLPPTTNENAEQGESYKRTLDKAQANFTELYGFEAARVAAEAAQSTLQYVDVTITSAEILALNATPIELVAAPGADLALIFEGIVAYKAAGAAYADIAAGEDIAVKYTDGSGTAVATIEATGFLDQTTAQTRYSRGYAAASGVSSMTPVANAALVAHMLTGEITTGDSDLVCRIYYRTIPTVL